MFIHHSRGVHSVHHHCSYIRWILLICCVAAQHAFSPITLDCLLVNICQGKGGAGYWGWTLKMSQDLVDSGKVNSWGPPASMVTTSFAIVFFSWNKYEKKYKSKTYWDVEGISWIWCETCVPRESHGFNRLVKERQRDTGNIQIELRGILQYFNSIVNFEIFRHVRIWILSERLNYCRLLVQSVRC